MRLYWIRHGETDWNRTFRFQGTSDVPLNMTGLGQAKNLAGAFDEPLHAIFCSPLLRTRQFAEPLARRQGLRPVTLETLGEMSFGRWEGKTYEELSAEEQQALIAWNREPDKLSPPGGESLSSVAGRVEKALAEIKSALSEKDRAAVITHGGVIRVMVALVLGAPLSAAAKMNIEPGSLTVIEYGFNGWKLCQLNETCHLKLQNFDE